MSCPHTDMFWRYILFGRFKLYWCSHCGRPFTEKGWIRYKVKNRDVFNDWSTRQV